MRYVGNMRKTTDNRFNNPEDKAVFPPGSIVPERVADNAVMYTPNQMNRSQQDGFRENSRELERNVENVVDSVINAVTEREDNADYRAENPVENSESMHGFMDYEGMEFPLPPGRVLKRTESTASDFVGSVEDSRGFSPANGLGGRPMEDNSTVSGGMMGRQMSGGLNQTGGMMGRPPGGGMGMRGSMVCGPSVRLGDVICMYAGKSIEIEFLFGADTYVKKSGILSGAGMNFIVLTDPVTMQKTICDLTDMKFISIAEQGGNM